MYLLKAPTSYPKDGDIYGVTLINGTCIVDSQWIWNMLVYLGFEDITPADWPKSRRKHDTVERVVFQHLGGIGDMLFTTVAYAAYRKAYPDIFTEVAASVSGAQLLVANPDITSINLDESPKNLIAKILSDQYDDAISFDCMLAGLGESTIKNIYDIVLDWVGLDLPDEEKLPKINLLPNEGVAVKNKLRKLGIDPNDKFITMQPESSTNNRNIKLETAFGVAEKLVEEGYKVIMFGTLSPGSVLRKKLCSCGKPKYVQFSDSIDSITVKCDCGQDIHIIQADESVKDVYILTGWSIREIACVIARSKCMIGIDSCGIHIAAAVNTPVLGLYSSFDGDLRMRYYRNATWLQKPYRCAPCFVHHIDCRWKQELGLKVPPCMDQFTVTEIVEAFRLLLLQIREDVDITRPEPFAKKTDIFQCPICGAASKRFVTRKGSVVYYDCYHCKTTYADHVPDNLAYYSDKAYWECFKREEYKATEKTIARNITKFFQDRFAFSGSILDVGCGTGGTLAELKRLGWEAAGAEASTYFPELAKELGNESVIPSVTIGDFMAYETEKRFDVVSFSHSLEHFPDIRGALKKGIDLLTDTGVINIIVPISDSWAKHTNTWAHINAYVPGEHAVLMTKETFLALLAEMGLSHQVIGENIDGTGSLWVVAEVKK